MDKDVEKPLYNIDLLEDDNDQAIESKFIETYRQFRHLWDVTDVNHGNTKKRNIAYDVLAEILKKLDPNANRISVRRKVNILRSTYRKEYRKLMSTKIIGANGQEIYTYKPNSWKFNALKFLDDPDISEDQYRPIIKKKKFKLKDLFLDELSEENNKLDYDNVSSQESDSQCSDTMNVSMGTSTTPSSSRQRGKSKPIEFKSVKIEQEEDEDHDHHHDSKDFYEIKTEEEKLMEKEYNAISQNVICKLRRMNVQQRPLAELLINRVLYKGLMNDLSDRTDVLDVLWSE